MAKYYRRSKEMAQAILDRFNSGNVPEALAQVFINRSSGRPMDNWSWTNQFLLILFGNTDARGYKQWQEVGRHVPKGQKATGYIMFPLMGTSKDREDENGDPVRFIRGFSTSPVWDIEATEVDEDPSKWEAHLAQVAAEDDGAEKFVSELPLLELAEAWEIKVKAVGYRAGSALGMYSRQETENGPENEAIALMVKNLSTWAHELVHAADRRLGNKLQDKALSEAVAEIGGATLLQILGYHEQSDLGGAMAYVESWAGQAGKDPKKLAIDALKRIANAVDHILTEAAAIDAAAVAEVPENLELAAA